MCGIVGIVNTNVSRNNDLINKRIIREMTGLLSHRGPDDEGFFIDSKLGVYLGHKRLSIIDLSERGHQPMFNKDKSLVLVYNGEVYNFKGIRKELESKGYNFLSNTDSEVIIYAYEEWGEECVHKFRGMFSFALWDEKKKQLFLVRDRLGIKPLYYLKSKDYFAFGSEAKAFLALKLIGWQPRLNEKGLGYFLNFFYIPDCETTMLKGILKLPPGHFLIYKNNQIKIKKYWFLDEDPGVTNLSFAKAINILEDLLKESIKLHLLADVPLAILLSGGLDSSTIAALAQKMSAQKISTFSAGFNHPLDEIKFAKIVAKYIGSDHHEIILDSREIGKRIEEMVWYFDDLSNVESGLFSTYLLCEKIREKGIKVILIGEGSDEIFGGYSWFGLSKFPFNLLPQYAKSALHYYAITRKLPIRRGFWQGTGYINQVMKQLSSQDTFKKVCGFELGYQLPNNILLKVDKATMAQSIEARVPYLDHKVVEFAYSLPSDYKLAGKTFSAREVNEKYILRQVAKKYLPPAIVSRKKRGFMLPIGTVMDANKQKLSGYLLDKNAFFKNLLGEKVINDLLTKKSNSILETEREWLAWKVFIFEVWATQYLK